MMDEEKSDHVGDTKFLSPEDNYVKLSGSGRRRGSRISFRRQDWRTPRGSIRTISGSCNTVYPGSDDDESFTMEMSGGEKLADYEDTDESREFGEMNFMKG